MTSAQAQKLFEQLTFNWNRLQRASGEISQAGKDAQQAAFANWSIIKPADKTKYITKPNDDVMSKLLKLYNSALDAVGADGGTDLPPHMSLQGNVTALGEVDAALDSFDETHTAPKPESRLTMDGWLVVIGAASVATLIGYKMLRKRG